MQLELETPFMQAHIADGVGWMTFNNPDRRNAMKLEMNRGVVQILEHFDASDEVRVVVMSGAGDKAFVSGADISEFDTHRSTPDGRANFEQAWSAANQAFASLQKPLIAMIRGFCIGGGLATALQADLRISADDGQFGIPAARLGLGYQFAGIKKLVHIVGPTMAAEVMLTARKFNATEAVDMGLINRVVPVDDLVNEVTALAATIAANAPMTVRAAKASVLETFKDPAHQDADRINALVEACFQSDDYVEGRTAFMEKRTPQFNGK
ncbi:enoyl-CoA hydratase [bacterium]|nr:enoyl-CoA hydratase [bacterium]